MSNEPHSDHDRLRILIRETATLVQSYVRPIIAVNAPGSTPTASAANGTITFIRTGRHSFGVTNNHVLSGLRRKLAFGGNIVCQVGELAFDIEDRLIDSYCGPGIDLATFRITKEELKDMHAIPIEATSWPPKPPRVGDFLFAVGYPGDLISFDSPTEMTVPFFGIGLPIVALDDYRITMKFDDSYLVFDDGSGDAKLLYNEYDFFGMSGSGVFAMKLAAEIAGILYGGNPQEGTIFCTRADCIREDGRILHR